MMGADVQTEKQLCSAPNYMYVCVFLALLNTKPIYAAVDGRQGKTNFRVLVFERNASPVAFLPAGFPKICTNDGFYHLFESL